MSFNKWYRKNNGMGLVYLIGRHPKKDFVAVTSGEHDVRWLSFTHFGAEYTEESGGEATK